MLVNIVSERRLVGTFVTAVDVRPRIVICNNVVHAVASVFTHVIICGKFRAAKIANKLDVKFFNVTQNFTVFRGGEWAFQTFKDSGFIILLNPFFAI